MIASALHLPQGLSTPYSEETQGGKHLTFFSSDDRDLLRAYVNFSMKEDQSIKSPENVGRGVGGGWSVGSVEEISLVETEVAVEVEVGSAIFLKALIFL